MWWHIFPMGTFTREREGRLVNRTLSPSSGCNEKEIHFTQIDSDFGLDIVHISFERNVVANHILDYTAVDGWTSMDGYHGHRWISMEFYRHPCRSTDICGKVPWFQQTIQIDTAKGCYCLAFLLRNSKNLYKPICNVFVFGKREDDPPNIAASRRLRDFQNRRTSTFNCFMLFIAGNCSWPLEPPRLT